MEAPQPLTGCQVSGTGLTRLQRRGQLGHAGGFHEGATGFEPADQIEGQQAAREGHLALGQIVLEDQT